MVCIGNICRSPTAHGVLQQKIIDAGLGDRVFIDSAGTAAWHIGKAPDKRSVAAAKKQGYDLSALRARQVNENDFDEFSLILAMDNSNYQDLLDYCPDHLKDKIKLFLPFGHVATEQEVPDPYYGGAEGFSYVISLVEQASDNLVARIQDGEL
nr:low molecular weight protein-tyrosine-phosphatase [Sansalvadorimonas sp. 2012CJ34-2]